MNPNETIEIFTNYLKRKGKAKSTIIAYKKDLEQLQENSKSPIEKINEEEIRRILKLWGTSGDFSTKTVSRKLNSIRTFYTYLLDKKVVKENPAENIHHPKFRMEKPRILSKFEYLGLKDCCSENLKVYTMVELLLQTGIRIGELSRIKIKDVNLNKKPSIYIDSFSSINSRLVPLNEKAVRALKTYFSTLSTKNKEFHLFTTKNGKSIEIRNIRSSIDKMIKKCKIKGACVNDIRNTFIVYQLSNGMSIQRVAEIVGHKSTVTTTRYIDLLSKQYKDKKVEEIVEL